MSRQCIGIDLGGTFVKFCLLDEDHVARHVFQLRTPTEHGPEAVIARMVEGGRRVLDEAGLSVDDVAGAGIGSPGPLDISAGVVRDMPNLPGFRDVPIRDRVGEGLGMPAVLENDANAAAFGEYLCGAGASAGDMVLLTLGTGVGSGIIIDGVLLHGAHEMGAELGHMVIEPGGEECGCGQRGCTERYCSATYMARHAAELIRGQGRESSLAARLDEKGEIDAKDIQEARAGGDELAGEVWDRGAYYLALACVNICRIFDPERIVLAGGLTKAGDALMKPVREHFARLHWSITDVMTEIVIAELGNDAGVIGAAGVAMQQFTRQTT